MDSTLDYKLYSAKEKLKDFILMLRPQQWYKNLVIYLALIFSWNITNTDYLISTTLGLISLVLVSSSYYIVNDVLDRKKDSLHPYKKYRPIVNGKISVRFALLTSFTLFVISYLIAYALSPIFGLMVLFMLLFTTLYTLLLKKIMIIDLLGVGVNFIVRAIAGAVIIGVYISPWLVLCPFFLSLFLAACKRKGDLQVSRTIYKKRFISKVIDITGILLLLSYVAYIWEVNIYLSFTLPFAIYVLYKYRKFTKERPDIIRNPNLALRNWPFVLGIIGWFITAILVLYL